MGKTVLLKGKTVQIYGQDPSGQDDIQPFTCQAHCVGELWLFQEKDKKKGTSLPTAALPAARAFPMGDPAPYPPPAEEIFIPDSPPWRAPHCSALRYWAAPSVSASKTSMDFVGRNYWFKQYVEGID